MNLMEISWLGHATFKIVSNSGIIIYLDAYQLPPDVKDKADITVSSHSHFDHFDKKSLKNLTKEGTIHLGPTSIAKNLARLDGKALDYGEVFEHEDIKIELIPGYTSQKPTHPKSAGGAGTIVEIEGKKIYHAGDSDRIPEMKELASKNITVALMPCGGQYTMDMEMATDCVLDIKPEIVIPMHNWEKDLSEFEKLMSEKDPNIKVEILENRTLKI
jgi:L-ascorbate metabolism protein UlaG (beta-lactamase superfamily)